LWQPAFHLMSRTTRRPKEDPHVTAFPPENQAA
jgi:hypothetical protein